VYLTRSLSECLAAATAPQGAERVCDLEPGTPTLLLLISFVTSAALMAAKIAQLELLVAKWAEHSRLQLELVGLLGEGAEPDAAAPAGPAPAAALNHFMAQPIVPPIVAGNLAHVAHAQAPHVAHAQAPQPLPQPVVPHPEPVVVRGVCEGCGTNVMSNDEGRKKEGEKYYHAQCIRGECDVCGRVVHTSSDRVRVGEAYRHRDCT
jgi:hypothetical protein